MKKHLILVVFMLLGIPQTHGQTNKNRRLGADIGVGSIRGFECNFGVSYVRLFEHPGPSGWVRVDQGSAGINIELRSNGSVKPYVQWTRTETFFQYGFRFEVYDSGGLNAQLTPTVGFSLVGLISVVGGYALHYHRSGSDSRAYLGLRCLLYKGPD